ncbi:MAG: DinB family protein [Phycisphaerales bacterium]
MAAPSPPARSSSARSTITLASLIEAPLRLALEYGKQLAADIPAAAFTTMPHATMNHPAFCFGHTSIYGDRMLSLLGRDDLVQPRPTYTELFQFGAVCANDASIYPPKDDIMAYYIERYTAVADALPDVPDDKLAHPNPGSGRMKELLPTIGQMVNFLAGAHHMVHLGQVSAWRRAMNLPPSMR